MSIQAIHYLGEFIDCQAEAIKYSGELEEIFLEAIKLSGAKIISSHFHQFKPFGTTGVVLLKESHASIHTWPEKNYAAVDFFSCNTNLKIEQSFNDLKKLIHANILEIKQVDRGKIKTSI